MTYKAFTVTLRDAQMFMESFAKRWALELGAKVEVEFKQPDTEGMMFSVRTYDPNDPDQVLCDADRFTLPYVRGRWDYAVTLLRWVHQWLDEQYGEKKESATDGEEKA